jgi:ribosomal protein S14
MFDTFKVYSRHKFDGFRGLASRGPLMGIKKSSW